MKPLNFIKKKTLFQKGYTKLWLRKTQTATKEDLNIISKEAYSFSKEAYSFNKEAYSFSKEAYSCNKETSYPKLTSKEGSLPRTIFL